MATLRDFQLALQEKLQELKQKDEIIEELEEELSEKEALVEKLQFELRKYRNLLLNGNSPYVFMNQTVLPPAQPVSENGASIFRLDPEGPVLSPPPT